jgi:hypothetical protein
MPMLAEAEAHPAPLTIEYWSPAAEGEFKNVFIFGVADGEVRDMKTKEIKIQECAYLIEQTDDGRLLRWHTAAAVLVGNIKSAISRNEIIPGTKLTPVRIIYKGLKRTKSGNNAASWEILRLIVSG